MRGKYRHEGELRALVATGAVYDPGRRYATPMSTTHENPHASDAVVGPHSTGDHGEDHGHDDHAHGAGEPLGPLDRAAWGAGALGIVAGLVVAAVMALSTGWLG